FVAVQRRRAARAVAGAVAVAAVVAAQFGVAEDAIVAGLLGGEKLDGLLARHRAVVARRAPHQIGLDLLAGKSAILVAVHALGKIVVCGAAQFRGGELAVAVLVGG